MPPEFRLLVSTQAEVEGVGTNISMWSTIRCHCCSREIQKWGDFSGHTLRLGVGDWLQWGCTSRSSGYCSSLSQILPMPTPLKRNPAAPPTQMPPVAPSFCQLLPACCPAASWQIPMLDGIRLCHCSSWWSWQNEGSWSQELLDPNLSCLEEAESKANRKQIYCWSQHTTMTMGFLGPGCFILMKYLQQK